MSASTADNDNNKDNVPDICANCGKGEDGNTNLKACTACKMVKYCNRECQIAHRSQHKKECKKRAAEMHEEALFKQPPPEEDCPICMLRMPFLISGRRYYGCCGKYICSGCACAPVYDDKGNVITEKACPFCRTPLPTSDEEMIKRTKKLMEAGDAEAIANMGFYYEEGMYGLPQDHNKALEFYHRAGKVKNPAAYCNIGIAYDTGRGVELDEKKARHYYELAAIGGNALARHNLGCSEGDADYDRAVKHFMIAVRGGNSKSLKATQELFKRGYATKDNYTKALEYYQAYLDEIKSDPRDKAAAADEDYKYIE